VAKVKRILGIDNSIAGSVEKQRQNTKDYIVKGK
jgi:hypothetical protein